MKDDTGWLFGDDSESIWRDFDLNEELNVKHAAVVENIRGFGLDYEGLLRFAARSTLIWMEMAESRREDGGSS